VLADVLGCQTRGAPTAAPAEGSTAAERRALEDTLSTLMAVNTAAQNRRHVGWLSAGKLPRRLPRSIVGEPREDTGHCRPLQSSQTVPPFTFEEVAHA
jgi:hypothetical protein